MNDKKFIESPELHTTHSKQILNLLAARSKLPALFLKLCKSRGLGILCLFVTHRVFSPSLRPTRNKRTCCICLDSSWVCEAVALTLLCAVSFTAVHDDSETRVGSSGAFRLDSRPSGRGERGGTNVKPEEEEAELVGAYRANAERKWTSPPWKVGLAVKPPPTGDGAAQEKEDWPACGSTSSNPLNLPVAAPHAPQSWPGRPILQDSGLCPTCPPLSPSDLDPPSQPLHPRSLGPEVAFTIRPGRPRVGGLTGPRARLRPKPSPSGRVTMLSFCPSQY